MTKTTRRLLIGLGAVVGVAAAFLLEERWRGQWELAAWKRQMIAKGERFTIAEIAPPVTNPAVRVLTPAEVQTLLAFRTGEQPPSLPGKRPVGAEFVMWALDSWPDDGWTNSWEEIARWFADTRERLAASRQELTNQVIQTRLRFEEGFDLLLPHLAAVKGGSQALSTGTLLALHEREFGEALDNLIAQQALVGLQANEPLLISQLVRIAVGAIAEASVRQALWADGWTDAQLAALQAAWEKPRFLPAMSRALEMERVMAAAYFTGDKAMGPDLREIFGSGGFIGNDAEVPDSLRPLANASAALRLLLLAKTWRFAWAWQDQLFHHSELQRLIEAARGATGESGGRSFVKVAVAYEDLPPDSASLKLARMNSYDRVRHWMSALVLASMDKGVQKALIAECTREMTVTAIALKRYQLKHGHYPEKLADLVPGFLTAVPRDWMDGQPLRYRLNADGSFTLWSVGTDGKDDGGDPAPATGDSRSMVTGRDIVWPRAATAEETAEAMKKSASVTPRGALLQQLLQGPAPSSPSAGK